MKLIKLLFFFYLFLASQTVHAVTMFFDSNLFYISDSSKITTTDTETKMFMDFGLGFSIDKRSQMQVGWNYSIFSTSTSGASTTSYSSTEMGPKFVYYFNRDRTWALGLVYNLIVNADFKPNGGDTQKWRGSSMKVDLGYSLPVSESTRLGLHLVYNSTSFNEQVTDTTLDQISYNRTFIYPAIHLGFLF